MGILDRRPERRFRGHLRHVAAGICLAVALAACDGVGATPLPSPTSNATPTLATGPSGFTATGSMGTARAGHTATLLRNGLVLIAGGYVLQGGGQHCLASAELYDPATGKFSITGSMGVARAGASATLLGDGRVLIAGGYGIDSHGATIAVAWAELYDPGHEAFVATGSLNDARYRQTATLLDDGRVLMVGGTGATAPLASAEIYQPDSGSFVQTASMADARVGHTATKLSDGRVLVTGGSRASLPGNPEYLASAEIYDPSTAQFAHTATMAAARYNAVAALLSDGRVLVAGGSRLSGADKLGLASAELYDPATSSFAATGSMSVGRAGPAIAPLPGGRVLVAGGQNLGGTPEYPATAEVFDPATGQFSAAGSMTTPRFGPTTTRLPDGRFLIAGGIDGGSVVASAELYQP